MAEIINLQAYRARQNQTLCASDIVTPKSG